MRASALVRRIDVLLAGLTIVVAAYLALRPPVRDWMFDALPTGARAALAYSAIALVVAVGLLVGAREGPPIRRAAIRVALYPLAMLLIAAGFYRAALRVGDDIAGEHWPPLVEDSWAARIDALPPGERAAWGAVVAAHGLASGSAGDVAIPADWSFPRDVQVAVLSGDSGLRELWARASDGTVACLMMPWDASVAAVTDAQRARCEKARAAPAGTAFAPPRRVPALSSGDTALVAGEAWPQYRRDAAKLGTAPTPTAAAASDGWRATIDGEIRASASAVGDLVLVGAHGTGALAALDLATGRLRWRSRLPNWIHQDAVSDGRIVVVGFGDNRGSFHGRRPAGVAAYETATGRHLWTRFDESSVMTSPIIEDSVLIYGSAAGVVRKRSLRTGELLAERALDGGVTMAPPASRGDTVVFTLELDRVCALRISTLALLWCRSLPDLRMLGHAAPTIADSQVIVSGAATVRTMTVSDFRRLPRHHQRLLARSALFPKESDPFAGQAFAALDLRDGRLLWRSRYYAKVRAPAGHIAGTAVTSGATSVIVLPIADTVVAFDRRTGAVRWTRGARGARGPVLIVDDRVIVSGRDGMVEVRSLVDGTLTCAWRRKFGFDRAGPALAGGLLIFADLEGGVEAIPKADVLACEV